MVSLPSQVAECVGPWTPHGTTDILDLSDTAAPDGQKPSETAEAGATSTSSSPSGGDAEDMKLWSPSAVLLLVATLAGAACLLAGLSLLGLGEGVEDEGRRLALRVLSWWCMGLGPFHTCACSSASFLMYGAAPGPERWQQLLFPFSTLVRVARLAREHGYSLRRTAAGSLVLHILPFTVTTVLLLAQLGDPVERFGLIVVYGVGNLMARPPSLLLMHAILPRLTKSITYMRRVGVVSMGFAVFGFYGLVGVHSLASLYLDPWPDIVLLPVLVAYELVGAFVLELSFARSFVAEPQVRSLFAGSRQGIFPSAVVLLLHGNAEAARLALLLNRVVTKANKADWSFVTAIAVSFAVNVTYRTGWALKLFQCTPIGKRLYYTNAMRQLDNAKFCMGYPRFFALLAIILARLGLGHSAFPSDMAAAAAVLTFVQEVLEDCVVFLARCCGLDAHRLLATPGAESGTLGALPDAVHTFRYRPDLRPVEAMPLWAHFLAVFPVQLHFVLCFAFTGWGVPNLLGYCGAIQERSCMGRGLIWWPPMDLDDPCRCKAP